MKLDYNAPFTLTFALVCIFILIIKAVLGPWFIKLFVLIPSEVFLRPENYIRIVSYSLGQSSWDHLLGNFSIILLVGPWLEEKLGSWSLLAISVITALVTGILHVLFFSEGLIGSSGIAFMLVILSGFVNFKNNRIPLTLILIIFIFMGKEIVQLFREDHISQFAHLMGGALGVFFGINKKNLTEKELNPF